MATIVNNPGPERVVAVGGGDSAGWGVAVVILLVVIAGGVFWWMQYRSAPAEPGSANINVTLPAGTTGPDGNAIGTEPAP